MTMTESPPSEAAESTEPEAAVPGTGLYDALTTSDHKDIGRIWLRVGLLLLTGVAVLGVPVALEATSADSVDVFGGVVHAERSARGRRDAEVFHHRLSAVMARANGHAFRVDDGAAVVRMRCVPPERPRPAPRDQPMHRPHRKKSRLHDVMRNSCRSPS